MQRGGELDGVALTDQGPAERMSVPVHSTEDTTAGIPPNQQSELPAGRENQTFVLKDCHLLEDFRKRPPENPNLALRPRIATRARKSTYTPMPTGC